MRHLTTRDYHRERWRNGGGETTELAAERRGDALVWRVSVAEVERSGPFSDYSGYARTLMLLEGRGMALSFAGGSEIVLQRPLEPFLFDGAWKTSCRLLDGPVRDLNLIADPARVHATLQVLRVAAGEIARIALACDSALVYAVHGKAQVTSGDEATTVASGEALRFEAPGAANALGGAGGCTLAIIRIRHLDSTA